ncbi:aminodeoxychorismate synthase component I [Kordiimonas sp. SCSIO 12610]|uniref:aminodeoxychorismate synthase component I n=1 Tax=Kordiimonas sp. SCSIO 12610 TaxID=2829597 RepID=UPI00210CC678|nr:aminodeoxychorismate synthase component I [Kordiimonas sp. SCSIO 12610]UTW55899.1 aminodeoxychorismate synthase component I [Kordiimonas sp. SCSIO 12610]
MAPDDLRHTPLVLLDDNRQPFEPNRSILFTNPAHIIKANDFSEIEDAILEIEEYARQGYYLAGWLAYECAYAFEPRLGSLYKQKSNEPLIWMMATKSQKTLSPAEVENFLNTSNRGNQRHVSLSKPDIQVKKADYVRAVEAIKDYILSGDVYQVNYTMPVAFDLSGDPLALYQNLRRTQPVAYGAYINTGKHQILSRSPELFIAKKNSNLTAKPMKGTAKRGTSYENDYKRAQNLRSDVKSRAENLMIVDLLRNDLSRISEPGSVAVEDLFDIETYPTLHQMTSTVKGSSKPNLNVSEMLKAIFPCGSVTGAPKIRAMEIIAELETAPRGVYCGAIGYIAPTTDPNGLDWQFNVPIRTLVIEQDKINSLNGIPNYKGRFHIGSGIVTDSNIEDEYNECLLKADFITNETSEFSLIETLRCHNGACLFKDEHLQRIRKSATYFGYRCDVEEINTHLLTHISKLDHSETDFRIRLLLDKHGACSITSVPILRSPVVTSLKDMDVKANATDKSLKVAISKQKACSSDKFLYHKTTNRAIYDQGFQLAQQAGYFDALFLNERGEIAESAIHNIFVLINGEWITPTQSSGLLNGVLRQRLIEQEHVIERTITHDDLKRASIIALGNSVRGLTIVTFDPGYEI